MEDLATDNSATAVADNPVMEPATNGTETGTTGGQAQGATPAADLFKGVDPNKLPPEVKAHYDSMLRDYRDKTSKLSETIKSEVARSTEALKAKAEFYDQIAAQEEFVRQWNAHVQKTQAQPTPEQSGDPALNELKTQLQQMNQKIQISELTQVTEAFADAVDEKGQKLRPDFDNLNSIPIGNMSQNGAAEEFSLLRACVELAQGANPQEKLSNGYKAAKEAYQAIFEMGRKSGMGRLQAKVLNGSNPPSSVGGDLISTTEKRPKNAREAMDLAKRGIVVSRED